MLFRDTLAISFAGLKKNSSRSLLTILGIVIGIGAIIIVTSVASEARSVVIREFGSLGSRTILVGAGREPKGPADLFEYLTNSLKERDVKALQSSFNVPELQEITPTIFQIETVSFEGETTRGTLLGANEKIFTIFDLNVAEGRTFTDSEVEERAAVMVVGSKIKDNLFGSIDPVGQKVRIRSQTFRVIGILAPTGNVSIFNIDEFMGIPYTTMQKYVVGTDYYNRIIGRASSESAMPMAVANIKSTLRIAHNIDDPSKDDFFVDTETDVANRFGSVASILTALLISVATISLVVGGVGIMNTMLVSVSERTREIGLRKALGAKNRAIMIQFLLEAVMLTLAGGIIGIAFGILMTYFISVALNQFLATEWNFVVSLWAIVIGVTVSCLVGLIFGIYPARQAENKSPLGALRYE